MIDLGLCSRFPQTRYKVEIGTTAAEFVEEVAFGNGPPPAIVCVEIEEKDVIALLSRGQVGTRILLNGYGSSKDTYLI